MTSIQTVKIAEKKVVVQPCASGECVAPIITSAIAPEKKELINTTSGRSELVGKLVPAKEQTSNSVEIYLVSLIEIVKTTINYEESWDELIKIDALIPIQVPVRKSYDVYAIYINSDKPSEYRLVVNKDLDAYYAGKMEAMPFKTFRYVEMGIMFVEPKLMITDPLHYDDGTVMTTEVLLEAKKDSKALYVAVGHQEGQAGVEMHVFGIYTENQLSSYPLEFRFVLDPDRIQFYQTNGITAERNSELMEKEAEKRVETNGGLQILEDY